MRFLDKVEADFLPARRDDLAEWARPFVGRRMVFQACWIIEHGPYEGQWAMRHFSFRTEFLSWTPESDLVNVEHVDAKLDDWIASPLASTVVSMASHALKVAQRRK